MTVRELIAKLQEMPQDLAVKRLTGRSDDEQIGISDVREDKATVITILSSFGPKFSMEEFPVVLIK